MPPVCDKIKSRFSTTKILQNQKTMAVISNLTGWPIEMTFTIFEDGERKKSRNDFELGCFICDP